MNDLALEIPTRKEVMAAARERGEGVVAVLPIHYPRALLRACGLHPVEVWGPPGRLAAAGAERYPEYTCDIVRRASRFLEAEGGGQVDAILVPHTCDALQGMATVLQGFGDAPVPVLTFYPPRGRRPSDRAFLRAELVDLAAQLGALSGRRAEADELHAAIDAEERVEAVFAELARHRTDFAVGDRQFYTVLRSLEYVPAEVFHGLAAGLPRGPAPAAAVDLLLGGIVPEPMAIFDHLNASGARVVADDLACVSRRIYPPAAGEDPFARLADRLLGAAPEPTLHPPVAARNEHVVEIMRRSGARGVVVYDVKFCEPELFYVPRLARAVREQGWPLLHLEVEMGAELTGQALTRLNAFVEVLS